VNIGEGVVGQAAAENKTILLTDIPPDYLLIQTGFGNIIPKNILVVPIAFEGSVVGIIELGSIAGFTKVQQQYMDIVVDSIAIAITSAQGREKVKELLEETQRQAEELETQQEELKQSNEELQVKTEMLEKSESELRAQQEELHQSNEELEEKANLLEEQKDRLEKAKMEIETKARELEVTSKYKSEFLANMSHELRTPLNSVLILAQILAENKNKTLGAKEMEFAKNICSSGTDLLNLINEILDLSKVESGKLELDIAEVPVKEIIENTLSMFSEVAKNKTIEFQISCEEKMESATISTDVQRLGQILRNLLSNAFKFTDKMGKVTLKIAKAPNGSIYKDKNLESQSMVAFSVTDTGIGIPFDKQQLIFEAFQQVDGSTKRKYGGTGLGLSISRELAHVLGGEIQLESTEGEGSTFTLFLPATFSAEIPRSMERIVEIKRDIISEPNRITVPINKDPLEIIEPEEVADDRYNIHENDKVVLLMEDDVSFAGLLLEFLRERNYKGIIATQGNTGLSYARHYKPDAIILDMKLPVMDGAEVLKQLKNDPALRHIPVQVISGYDRKREGMELGAFDFIRKPVTKED
jgi:signal transduction histidine kinase